MMVHYRLLCVVPFLTIWTAGYLTSDARGLLAGWETKGQIYYTSIGIEGELASAGEVHVSDRGRYPVALRSDAGVTLVSWKDGTQLRWQRFDVQERRVGEGGSAKCRTSDRLSGVVTKSGEFILFP